MATHGERKDQEIQAQIQPGGWAEPSVWNRSQ